MWEVTYYYVHKGFRPSSCDHDVRVHNIGRAPTREGALGMFHHIRGPAFDAKKPDEGGIIVKSCIHKS